MPAPLTEDELTRVAAYLAAEKRKQQGGKLPSQVLDRVYTNRPTGMESSTFSGTGFSKASHGDQDREGLEASGFRYLPQDDFDAMRQNWNPVDPPPGKLPFISNTPTHEGKPAPQATPAPAPAADPRLTSAMAQAATAARLRGGPPSSPPPPARPTSSGAAKRRREVGVSTTSATGPQPAVRDFRPLAQLAPADAAKRLEGLPEGVASVMRKRWGLEDAQADSNRRALAVELASAGNQVGSGLAGGKYEDSTWNHQRAAAGQPVEDYQARSNEERAHNEEARRAAEDEREAHAAAEHARMELERFEYGKTHDKAQDQLARDRMAQEGQMASDRLASEGKSRSFQREDMRLRQADSAEAKKEAAAQKRQDMLGRQHEKDLQTLGQATTKAPYGEFQQALQEIDRQVPGMVYGQAPEAAPMGVGDRIARSVPLGLGNWAVSDEGQKYGQAIANLRDLVSRMRSGAVLSPGEEKHYLSLLGDDVLSDPRKAAAGINAVRQGVSQKLRNAQASYVKTGVLDDYEGTGATTFRAPIFSGTGRRVAVVDPSGRPATIDESELTEALKDGWRRR